MHPKPSARIQTRRQPTSYVLENALSPCVVVLLISWQHCMPSSASTSLPSGACSGEDEGLLNVVTRGCRQIVFFFSFFLLPSVYLLKHRNVNPFESIVMYIALLLAVWKSLNILLTHAKTIVENAASDRFLCRMIVSTLLPSLPISVEIQVGQNLVALSSFILRPTLAIMNPTSYIITIALLSSWQSLS
jgi:hypothetical protein